jgi:hypothetical protein
MTLTELGIKHGTDKATFHQFTGFYDRKLQDLKQGDGAFLELGIYKGDSLRMWRDWLPNLSVCGFDITLHQLTENPIDGCAIAEVDCGDEMKVRAGALQLLDYVKQKRFRCVIDDASHLWAHQKAAFRALWPLTDIYIIEDLHTSLRPEYSGGDKTPVYVNDSINLDFGCTVNISYFQRLPNESWTAIIRRV